jgi:hypothetical protein
VPVASVLVVVGVVVSGRQVLLTSYYLSQLFSSPVTPIFLSTPVNNNNITNHPVPR